MCLFPKYFITVLLHFVSAGLFPFCSLCQSAYEIMKSRRTSQYPLHRYWLNRIGRIHVPVALGFRLRVNGVLTLNKRLPGTAPCNLLCRLMGS